MQVHAAATWQQMSRRTLQHVSILGVATVDLEHLRAHKGMPV